MDDLALKLARKLGVETVTPAIEDALDDAEAELLLYLNREELPKALRSKCVELAAVFYRRDTEGGYSGNVKSETYTEGSVSQSQTFSTSAESASAYSNAADDILSGCARYRLVKLKNTPVTEEQSNRKYFTVEV